MIALDINGAQAGAVRIGIAQIIRWEQEVGGDDEAIAKVLLESDHGQIQARGPGRLLARAGVSESDAVVAAGMVDWVAEGPVLELQMLRRVESQGATTLSIWDIDPYEEIHVELPTALASYVLWLMCRDLARWAPGRRSRLARDEAAAFAMYLHHRLPVDWRTTLPAPPAQRVA
jgi:hypothetical protein